MAVSLVWQKKQTQAKEEIIYKRSDLFHAYHKYPTQQSQVDPGRRPVYAILQQVVFFNDDFPHKIPAKIYLNKKSPPFGGLNYTWISISTDQYIPL